MGAHRYLRTASARPESLGRCCVPPKRGAATPLAAGLGAGGQRQLTNEKARRRVYRAVQLPNRHGVVTVRAQMPHMRAHRCCVRLVWGSPLC